MTYRVTELDIRKGIRNDPCRCPIARAMRRRHPGVGVWSSSHYGYLAGKEVVLPERVKQWIRSFDAGEEVRPIMWEM